MLKSLWRVWLLIYHGAPVIIRKIIDWNDCMIAISFDFFTDPLNVIPYDIAGRIIFYR